MDDLVTFVSDLSVDSSISNNTAAPHPRFSGVKTRKISNQEKRRALLLEEQKRRRTETFNAFRDVAGVSEEKSAQKRSRHTASETESAEDGENDQEINEYGKKLCLKKIGYKNTSKPEVQLMLSEWLVDVPSDLSTEWCMVPCPEGRRSYVCSFSKKTKAFTKHGYGLMNHFKSTLPKKTILDCIWCAANSTFYVLDVLEWNGMTMLECETEFRFAWLQGKFKEMEESFVHSPDNQFAFVLLPFYACTNAVMSDVMLCYPLFPNNVPHLDGLLFYHKRTHYYIGTTPLVGWLKPHMVQEALGIAVAEEFKTLTSTMNKGAKKQNCKTKSSPAVRAPSPDSMETVETKNEECMTENGSEEPLTEQDCISNNENVDIGNVS